MRLAMIVAAAENNTIGAENQLPWHLPEDLKYFKRVTMGKPIVMGRKTYESIGRPLPGRPNIVITRNSDWKVADKHAETVTVVDSVDAAIAAAEDLALINACDEVMVIGGAEIYKNLFSRADRLYLTRVHADVEGMRIFSQVDSQQWQLLGEETFKADKTNPYDYSFQVLERAKA